jgi:hypothetical protein
MVAVVVVLVVVAIGALTRVCLRKSSGIVRAGPSCLSDSNTWSYDAMLPPPKVDLLRHRISGRLSLENRGDDLPGNTPHRSLGTTPGLVLARAPAFRGSAVYGVTSLDISGELVWITLLHMDTVVTTRMTEKMAVYCSGLTAKSIPF